MPSIARLTAVMCSGMIAVLVLGSVASAQPDIRSIVAPAPNARGWNNTPVTVSFICAGTPSCPEAVMLSDEGATQRVTRAVEDAESSRAEATAIVSIDTLPPTLSLIGSTPDRTTTDATVTIGAMAHDDGSGVVMATCNGEPAHLSGGRISCTRALRDGANDIVVSAVDAAGNSSAAAVRIWREVATRGIHIVPQQITIGVKYREILQVLDDSGRTRFDPVCTSADPAVAQVLEDAFPCTVKGVGAGETTITASVGSMTAMVTVAVVDAPKPRLDTTLLALPPTSGFTVDQRVQPASRPGGPALMLIEMADDGASYRVKAITREPRVLWYEWPAIAAHERIVRWMGDTTGGALLLLKGAREEPSAIVRIGQSHEGTLWRYESAGRLDTNWAMNWQGALFIVETPRDGFPQIVGIDSLSGRTLFRLPVPRAGRTPPIVGNATVLDREAAAFAFIDVESSRGLRLLRVQSDGQFTVDDLWLPWQ